jgi:hypothetical protein
MIHRHRLRLGLAFLRDHSFWSCLFNDQLGCACLYSNVMNPPMGDHSNAKGVPMLRRLVGDDQLCHRLTLMGHIPRGEYRVNDYPDTLGVLPSWDAVLDLLIRCGVVGLNDSVAGMRGIYIVCRSLLRVLAVSPQRLRLRGVSRNKQITNLISSCYHPHYPTLSPVRSGPYHCRLWYRVMSVVGGGRHGVSAIGRSTGV